MNRDKGSYRKTGFYGRMMIVIGIILLWSISLFADETSLLYDDSAVSVIEITVDPGALQWMYNNVWSDSMHNADFHFSNAEIDEELTDVGFRLRGNTSRLAQKKSFKISFNDFVAGREFYGIDKMNLNGEHNDPSIIRSKLCWDLYQQMGMKTSRAAHAAVYVNDEYYGLYVSIEHIDDEFLEKHFADDSGNLWKCNYLARLDYLGDDPELYKFENNGSRVYELKRNEEEDDYSQLLRLIDIINNTPQQEMADSLMMHLDVGGVLKYFAMDVLTGSWDDYWYGKNNFYIYHEPAEDRFYIIPYDYDNTMGVDWMDIDWTERDIYVFKHPEANRPLADSILGIDTFRNLYTHFLEYYSEEMYALSLWEERIDSLQTMISPYAEEDVYRTLDYGFTMADFYNSYSDEYYLNQHVKKGLKQFINERNESLQSQLEYVDAAPALYAPWWSTLTPAPRDTVFLSIAAFAPEGISELWVEFFETNGTARYEYPLEYSPLTGTGRIEDNDRWVGAIPPMLDLDEGYFRFIVISNDGNWNAYPYSSRIKITTQPAASEYIYINELLAVNDNTNYDEAGEYDDWVELYNNSQENIDLSGCYLSDDSEEPLKWQFPEGSEIAAEQHMLLWCDDDEEQGIYHTSFKLSSGGEEVILTAADGITVFDEITFAEQTADISFGRSPDGSDNWVLMNPSPAEENINVTADDDELCCINNIANFPNPFNPVTTISFELDQSEYIELAIFNLKGQKAAVLLNEELAAGKHQILWDSSLDSGECPSGVYIYQLKTKSGYSYSGKCVLLK